MVFLISVYMNQVHFLSWLFGILSVLALANLCVVKINRNNQLWSAHAKVLLVWSCFFSCYENSILLLFTDRYAPRARTRDLCEVQWLEQWSKKLLKLRATFLGFSVWRLRAVELKANKRKDKIIISEHKLRQVHRQITSCPNTVIAFAETGKLSDANLIEQRKKSNHAGVTQTGCW